MFGIDRDTVGRIAGVQLIFIVIFGFLHCTFVQQKYHNSPPYRVFKQGEYTSGLVDDSEAIFQTPPKWFRFVIVKYETDGQVGTESFYTVLGDVTTIKFSEGHCIGMESNPYSNFVFVAAAVMGMSLVGLSNLLISPGLAPLVGDRRIVAQQLTKFGVVMFCSVFLSAPIKIVFDFANHLNLPVQQSSSN